MEKKVIEETDIMAILFELHQAGVTGVNIYYEGSGDSGCIESAVFTKNKLSDVEDTAFDEITQIDAWDGAGSLGKVFPEIYVKLEEFVTDCILDDIEDWWNNDGGYGTLCIIVPSGKYKVYNSIRYTKTEDYYHEGELLEKTN